MACLLLIGATGCSSDDTQEIVVDPTEAFNADEAKDSIVMELRLLGESGEVQRVFAEGENVIFELSITNNSSRDVRVPSPEKLLSDAFHVYSSQGDDLGNAFQYILPIYSEYTLIKQGETCRFVCPWYYSPSIMPNSIMVKPEEEEVPFLSKGEYFTKFDVKLNDQTTISCRQDFIVR